jgi:hypothetical protein
VVNTAIEGFGVTAAVAFASPNYVVTISKGTAKSIYIITGATFTPTNTYTITAAPVAGGTATVTASHATAYAGDTVTVDIIGIQTGKRFLSIAINGGDVTTTQVSAGAHYTFTMPEGAVTVTVTLESIPGHAAYVTGNNILIVGRHAFNLDATVQAGLAVDKKYNLTNFTTAISNWVYQPTAEVKAIYYRAGNKWYNLTTAQGQGLVPAAEVSVSEINGDGVYHYLNMDLIPGVTP